jgi:hypothetical protein
MRATISLSLAAAAIVAMCLLLFVRQLRERQATDITFAFEEDLVGYIHANNEKLPYNWNEFSDWSAKNTPRHWEPKELQSRFRIPWGMNPLFVKTRPIIVILAANLVHLQSGINDAFDRQLGVNSGGN